MNTPRLVAARASAFRHIVCLCLLLVCAGSLRAQEQQPPQQQTTTATKKANERPAAVSAQASASQREPFDGASVERMAAQCVRLETEAGVVELELLPEAAPETVRNFLNLVALGAYDTTTFSRVIPGFVVQGGNLATREKITMELVKRSQRTIRDEPNYVKHLRGVVSMARPAQADSATTHFFILVGDSPHLDNKFAAFGRVTRGMEVVDAINKMPGSGDKPDKPVRLNRATVYACPPATAPKTN
ncbi:MAG TPA: peptidylprolyl isomerase [Pyrinomonadaceae bacterium]|nr:peptidylprolyl isomerase [Pyrinomonadaceae bacterium]